MSLSRTPNLVVVAASHRGRVGVDVERVNGEWSEHLPNAGSIRMS